MTHNYAEGDIGHSRSARFRGTTALVTGGGSGIGLAIVRSLLAEGASVMVADRSRRALEVAQKELTGPVLMADTDVTDEAAVEVLVESCVRAFAAVDIAFNCAGVPSAFRSVLNMRRGDWDAVVDTNLRGVFLSIKHEAAQMVRQGRGGAIVNVSSINARQPAQGAAAYCAAKAGVDLLTRCAALELAREGIRVVSVSPGIVDSGMTAGLHRNAPLRQAFLDTVPLGRLGRPEDIASAALFLASSGAGWITGADLTVDGGETLTGFPDASRFPMAATISGQRDEQP